MKDATATLCAHAGAVEISRANLSTIQPPRATATHTPIRHAELVDLIEYNLKKSGMLLQSEQYAVQTDGLKLFGTMVLKHQTRADFNFAIGLRTSNDKTIPVQLVAGGHVFVCDNMCFSGEAVTLTRKHTSRIDIRYEIQGGVSRALERFGAFDNRVQELKALAITDNFAKAKILDAAVKEVMPLRMIPHVVKHYFEPPHEEFQPRTAWSLHNAFTESFKLLKPNVAMESNMELGKMFRL